MNIYIAGIYSAGKTAAAKELSKLIGWPVVDPDDLFIAKYGPHKEFSEKNGWAAIVEIWPSLLEQIPDGSIVPNSFFSKPEYDEAGVRDMEFCKSHGRVIFLQPHRDADIAASICHRRSVARGYAMSLEEMRAYVLHSAKMYMSHADIVIYDDESPVSAARKIKEALERKDLL